MCSCSRAPSTGGPSTRSGHRRAGSALIVSDDRLHHPNLRLAIVVPGTTTLWQLPPHVTVEPDADNGLDRTTAFQAEQVRAVSAARLVDRLDSEARHTVDGIRRNALDLH